MSIRKVGILTAGGLAPCLSSAIGALIERYSAVAPTVDIVLYKSGYRGLLLGDKIEVTPAMRKNAAILHGFGGSPIGNSRTKLKNRADCEKRGFVKAGQDPEKVACDTLLRDGIDVLHTIGGDDTNTAAADLSGFLKQAGHDLSVIGLPKTVDNDVFPIRQSLGAATAAEQGARFFSNVVSETGASARMLIIHEVMGRHCGWLTAATAHRYMQQWRDTTFAPEFGLTAQSRAVHAVFIPEMTVDLEAEAKRLRQQMDSHGAVNIFLSEGACVESIVAEMRQRGEAPQTDAFGHVKLDTINPGAWFGKQFASMIDAEKTLVQKSGYFARSAPPNAEDLALIKACCNLAVDCALRGESGVVGQDEDRDGELRLIAFDRIKGGKPFNPQTPWFKSLLAEIGQA